MHRMTVRLPDKLVEEAKIRAAKTRTTLQQILADALRAYLKTPLPKQQRAKTEGE